jgi:hypothetical protein
LDGHTRRELCQAHASHIPSPNDALSSQLNRPPPNLPGYLQAISGMGAIKSENRNLAAMA